MPDLSSLTSSMPPEVEIRNPNHCTAGGFLKKKWTFYKSDLLKYNLLTENSLFWG